MTRHEHITIDVDVRPRVTACYLRLAGDECAFIETHTTHALPRLMGALAGSGRRPEDVRWVIVTHAHLDHAGGAAALLRACPRATLLAHPRAARNLIDPAKLIEGATAVYGERFGELYGEISPVPRERVHVLADGEGVELGGARLEVRHTTGHAYHHFVVDDPAVETVYTGDSFGVVYPDLQRHGRFALPTTSPTGFDAAQAIAALDLILGLGERFVCPTHFGAWEDTAAIAAQVRRFLERAGAWVDAAAQGDEDSAALEAHLAGAWRQAIVDEAPAFGAEELAALESDIEINAQGLAYAAIARRGR